MIKTIEKAKRVQLSRVQKGKTGLAQAVKRFLTREKLSRSALK